MSIFDDLRRARDSILADSGFTKPCPHLVSMAEKERAANGERVATVCRMCWQAVILNPPGDIVE